MCLVLDAVHKTGYSPRKLFDFGAVGIIGMSDLAIQAAAEKHHRWLVEGKLDKDMIRFLRKLIRSKRGR